MDDLPPDPFSGADSDDELGKNFEENPLSGMPLFGDLAKLFSQQGPIGWDAARQLALSIATDGGEEGNVDPLERIRLEQLARIAELHVGNATGLPTSFGGTGISIVPVTRGQWATTTLESWRPLFERLAGSLTPPATPTTPDPSDPLSFMAPLMAMMGPMMMGMTAGSMIGHLSRRSFGQYDLPVPRIAKDDVMVIPANFETFASEWSIPADDLRLWVCAQEIAMHSVLRIPHVRATVDEFLSAYAAGFEPDPNALEDRLGSMEFDMSDPASMSGMQSMFGDPELLLGAIQSQAQRDMLPKFEALIATMVGYVDHIVDAVGSSLLSNTTMISEAVRRRRVEADDSDRFVERLFGLELTQATYDRGAAFVAGIVERAGNDGLVRLWESERTLPTPAELEAPGLWLARIELPD
ncbi:MAG: zinc-dependent metalloprotease [Actinobacteria bacterium]|nr:zinc-dependent metalloprotease [Actinomycetota bacterium]